MKVILTKDLLSSKFFLRKKFTAGFTLQELLVTIAIAGILASFVTASVISLKKKGRDTRRIAELKNISYAIEKYFQDTYSWPTSLDNLSTYFNAGSTYKKDPLGVDYGFTTTGLPAGVKYCLGADLEWVTPTDVPSFAPCNSLDINIYDYQIQGP